MKLHIGSLAKENHEISENWVRLKSPQSRKAYFVAGLVGLITPVLLILGIILFSLINPSPRKAEAAVQAPASWGAVLLVLLVFIPLHELVHAVFQPGMGLTQRTVLVVWPQKILFGVYFDGCMSRRQWIIMRLAPLIMLSIIPAGLLLLFRYVAVPYAAEIFTQVLMLVNGVGSGGDLVAVSWVLWWVPKKSKICFANGQAYSESVT